jgi:hypothetical protein
MDKLLFKLIILHSNLDWNNCFVIFNSLCKTSKQALYECSIPVICEHMLFDKNNKVYFRRYDIRIPMNTWFRNTFKKIGECIFGLNLERYIITLRKYDITEVPILIITGTRTSFNAAYFNGYISKILDYYNKEKHLVVELNIKPHLEANK